MGEVPPRTVARQDYQAQSRLRARSWMALVLRHTLHATPRRPMHRHRQHLPKPSCLWVPVPVPVHVPKQAFYRRTSSRMNRCYSHSHSHSHSHSRPHAYAHAHAYASRLALTLSRPKCAIPNASARRPSYSSSPSPAPRPVATTVSKGLASTWPVHPSLLTEHLAPGKESLHCRQFSSF